MRIEYRLQVGVLVLMLVSGFAHVPKAQSFLQAMKDPSANSAVGSRESTLKLTATTDQQNASLTLGDAAAIGNLLGDKQTYLAAHITLSTPVAKGSTQPAELADQDGLSNQASVELGINGTLWTKVGQNDLDLLNTCIAYKAAHPAAQGPCSTALFKDSKKDQDAFLDEAFKGKHLWTYSLSAKISENKKYDFFDPKTGEKTSDHLESRSASVGFGLVNSFAIPTAFNIGYTNEHSYKEQNPKTYCVPSPQNSVQFQDCSNLPVGAPTPVEKRIYTVETRVILSNVALRPAYHYDEISQVKSGELNTYLVKNSDGAFTGGVTLGWRSDTANTLYSVFIGSALSLTSQ